MLQKTIDTKCHQHLDSEEDGKGTKATLDVNLRTCGLCHTENLGYPIRQFAKRVFTSASFVDAMIPQMCPFSEPDLVQNSQQTQFWPTLCSGLLKPSLQDHHVFPRSSIPSHASLPLENFFTVFVSIAMVSGSAEQGVFCVPPPLR